MRNLIAASLLAMCVSACATAPQQTSFQNTKTVASSFDEAWDTAISYFAENNVSIKTLEKDSGIVVAEAGTVPYQALLELADCGTQPLASNYNGGATYNVFVREASAGTIVQVNAKFLLSYFDRTQGGLTTTECFSKGIFEQGLLARF